MSYITKLLEVLSNSKNFVNTISHKVALKAKRSGRSFKDYIHDNENVSHISLVVYDILPLPLKFAMRYEKFDKAFVKNFSLIRSKLFTPTLVEQKEAIKPSSARTTAKKAAIKKAVKNTSKVADITPSKINKIEKAVSKVASKRPPQKSVVAKKSTPAKKVVRKTVKEKI